MRQARRRFVAVAVAAGLLAAPAVRAADHESPAEIVGRLKAGNAIFVANPERALPITAAARSAAAQDETPFASVLSCADARVPPEVIFHAGLGDLFVIRTAGHVADRSVVASLEYAADHLHVPLIVVMGHESCSAVKAAIDAPAASGLGPNLDYLIKAIRPAVAATSDTPDATRLRAAILQNVEDTVNDLMDQSARLHNLAAAGTIGLVGAYYELSTGRVYFSEPAGVTVQARTGAAR